MEPINTPQSPEKPRKKQYLGLIAFCIIMAAILFLIMAGLFSYFSYRKGTLAGAHINLLSAVIILCTVLSGISLVLGILTLFRKKQRKGFAIAGFLLSIAVLLVCVGSMYLYNYLFGNLTVDTAFQSLSPSELHMVSIGADGRIERPTSEPIPVYTAKRIIALQPSLDVEYEELSIEALPQQVQDIMKGTPPEGSSYLMGRYREVENFLLIGLDAGSAADSMMVFSIDRVHQKLKMISIPRDSYLVIPEFGIRCKAAYSYCWGGAQMTVGMLNHNLSLNIQNYIAVSTDELPTIIDWLGGVDVELNQADIVALSPRSAMPLSIGVNHLDGDLATYYARNRKDNEINRTGRQRNVVKSMLSTLRAKPFTEYPSFIRQCLGLCTTSFSADRLLELATEAAQNNYQVEAYALIDNVEYWGGILGEEQYFYLVYDRCKASDWIYRTIYEDLYQSGYPD